MIGETYVRNILVKNDVLSQKLFWSIKVRVSNLVQTRCIQFWPGQQDMPIFSFFSNFNIVGYFFGAFLCVEQMLENTFSSKTPFSFVNLTINFTKGLAQKYKGKCVDLVFSILCFKIARNCWFCSHRSICLLNAVLLIPILLWLIKFYVV